MAKGIIFFFLLLSFHFSYSNVYSCRLRLAGNSHFVELGQWVTLESKSGNFYSGFLSGASDGIIYLKDNDGLNRACLTSRLRNVEEVEKLESVPPLPDELARLRQRRTTDKRIPQRASLVTMSGSGNERILVLLDKKQDPVLYDWIEANKSKVSQAKTPMEKYKVIFDIVQKTFSYHSGSVFHPIRRKRFKDMTTNADTDNVLRVKLGDFIKNGTGVCRHQALAFSLLAQESGLDTRMEFGDLSLKSYGEKDSGGYHMWNSATIDGVEHVFDPTNNIMFAAKGVNTSSSYQVSSPPVGRIAPVEYVYDRRNSAAGVAELTEEELAELNLN